MPIRNLATESCQEIEGAVAIVTGASRGIGRAVAIALASCGARVVCVGRDEGELAATVRGCIALDGQAVAVPTDVGDLAHLKRLVARTHEVFGPVDIVVHNAAVMRRAPINELELGDLDVSLGVNVAAVVRLTHLLAHDLMKRAGTVITISSIAGKMGFSGSAVYAATKHAVLGFSASVFEDLREHGVKVSAICPGYVNTGMTEGRDGLNPQQMIQPDDIADAVLYIVRSSATVCPTEIVLRPQRSPYLR